MSKLIKILNIESEIMIKMTEINNIVNHNEHSTNIRAITNITNTRTHIGNHIRDNYDTNMWFPDLPINHLRNRISL
jgi:hypothetical protein